MRGLERAVRKTHHIDRVGRKTESVAELVKDHQRADQPERSGLHERQDQIDRAGQRQAQRHRHQALAQAEARDGQAAEDTARQKGDHPRRAIDQAEGRLVQPEPADGRLIAEEGIEHLHRESLGQAEEQHEGDGKTHTGFGEERTEGAAEFAQHFARIFLLSGPVVRRAGQQDGVEPREQRQQSGSHQQGHPPGLHRTAGAILQPAGQHHQHSLPEDHRHAVEGVADAHESGLGPFVERNHVVAVGRNIVSGRSEAGDHEEDEREGKGGAARQRKGHQRHRNGHQELHHHDPPPLAAENIHERAPEGLEQPRQPDQAGEQRHSAVVHAQILENQDGDGIHNEIREPLEKVERGDPDPRGGMFARVHRTDSSEPGK